jgi:hypothetical protein
VPINNADDGFESKRNNFGSRNALPYWPCPPRIRARAIQIRQNLGAPNILVANVQAVSSLGKSIRERLTKKSVVYCVTTLYEQLVPELNATTTREGR